MIAVWLGISVFSAVILLGISVMALMLYGKAPKDHKKLYLLQAIGFLLILLQAIIIYIPMPATYADMVILVKLIASAVAYVLIGVSFLLQILELNAKPAHSKKPVKKK